MANEPLRFWVTIKRHGTAKTWTETFEALPGIGLRQLDTRPFCQEDEKYQTSCAI